MEYLTNDTELASVADAIRAKGGTTEQLAWPDGFASAIEALKGGTSAAFINAYYRDYLAQKLEMINDDILYCEEPLVCWWMFADYHWHSQSNEEGNVGGVGDIIRYLASETGVSDCVFLGDVLNYENTQALVDETAEQFAKEIEGLDRLMIVKGNHDNNPYGSPVLTDAEYIEKFMSNMNGNYGIEITDKTYYYRDDAANKVRFIVTDSRETSMDYSYSSGSDEEKAYVTEQARWIADTLSSTPDGYTVVIFAHVMWWGTSDQSKVTYSASNIQITAMANAYNNRASYSGLGVTADFSSAVGEVACIMTGHTHKDMSQVINDIPVISMSADGYAAANARPDYVDHEVGTVTEHSIDFVMLFTESKLIITNRIGAGFQQSRRFEYGENKGQRCSVSTRTTYCNSDNAMPMSAYGSYSATITPSSGYKMRDVTVTMCGADVTENYVTMTDEKATVSLPNVFGPIVITANAARPALRFITSSLTHVTTSNNVGIVYDGTEYTANLTAEIGYSISSVTVTMGGTDITSSAYADGVVSIASVTGDVVITATADYVASYTNVIRTSVDADGSIYNGIGYANGYYISGGTPKANAADFATGYIPYFVDCVNKVDATKPIYIKGYTGSSSASHTRMQCSNESKAHIFEFNGFLSTAPVGFTVEQLDTDYYKLTPTSSLDNSFSQNIGFIRFSFAQADGSGVVITIDEPIE